MTAKWKQIETYKEAIKLREGKFVMTPDQAQMVLDLKKKELQKSKYLSILDISAAEVKKLAKKDRSIEKVIGKLGGSFRVNLLKSKAGEKAGAVGGYRQMKSRTPAQLKALRKQLGIKNWDEDAPTVHTGPAIAGTGDDSSTVVVRKKKKKEIITGEKPMSRLDGRTKAYKLHAQRLQAQRERRQKLKDLGEKFTKKDFRKNEDENEHTKNSYELAQMFGDSSEKRMMTKIYNNGKYRGLSRAQSQYVTMIQTKYFRKLKEEIDSKSNKFTKGLEEKFSDFSREEFIQEDNVAILRDIVKRKQAKPIKLKDGQMKIDMNSANAIIKNLVDAPKNFMKDDTRKKVLNIINKGKKAQFLRLIDMLYK